MVCSDVDYTSIVYTDEYAAEDQLRIRYGFRQEGSVAIAAENADIMIINQCK
jgi:hypothetical protein